MELNEALEKYGETMLTFSHYYKYSFTFSGFAEDGTGITMETGGNADDIYRYEVTNDPQMLASFQPEKVAQNGKELNFSYDSF